MFAIAFDLDFLATAATHPKSVQQAYRDIERAMHRHGFRRVQQSVFLNDEEDMVALVAAISDLKSLPWFPACVRDIRAFRVENWSDFTPYVKSAP